MNNLNFRPTVFWAWNGDMKDDDLRRELAGFAKAGIGGVHVHARAGLEIDYLGKEWFRAYQTTVDTCREFGLDVWIYDEQGWPSGFAGGIVPAMGEDYQLKYLEKSDTFDKRFENRILGAYRRENGTAVPVEEGGQADFYVYYEVQRHYVDLMNPAVTEEFIRCTHEEYAKRFSEDFGKTIKGVFTDEPQIHVSARAWSVVIPEAFYSKYGERAKDKLFLLFEEGKEAREFRFRYYSVVRELFVKNFTAKCNDWCSAHGLYFTGHFAAEDGLCVQTASNTGVMPHYEYMTMPGIDHLGRKLNPVLLMKQVQSAARQFGRSRILSETYACTGNGVSFRELAWIWYHQAAFGVNVPCLSISMHALGGVRKRDYPVFFSEQQPWWEAFKSYADFMTNVSEFIAQGKYEAEVLLLSAVDSALSEPIFSSAQKSVSAEYRRLVESLVALQIPFDIGDERILARHGRAENGALTCGEGTYKIVILPRLETISKSTLELLEGFANSGGKLVVMTSAPARYDGSDNPECAKRFDCLEKTLLQDRRGILKKYFDAVAFRRKFWITDSFGTLGEGLVLTYGETGSGRGANLVLFNPDTDSKRFVNICAEGYGKFVSVNPQTLEQTPIQTVWGENVSYAEVAVSAAEGKLLRFERGEKPSAIPIGIQTVEPFEFRLAETGENALVLDCARYRVGEGEWSRSLPLVKILDRIYEEAEENGGTVKVLIEYLFTNKCGKVRLSLAAETAKAKRITVNGVEIPVQTDEFYLDRAFKRYDISNLAVPGDNRICLEFEITPLNLGFKLCEVHDSVRNKFSYPIETESAFLVGDFSVSALETPIQKQNCVSVGGPFEIVPRTEPAIWDLTSSGYWFYAGNAVYEGTVSKESGERVTLRLCSYAGAAAEISVNGSCAGIIFLADAELELTKLLKIGENKVTVKLLGTLRNLLGPHHHFKGETELTGVHTFTGDYGNGAVEDLVSTERPNAVWTDNYGLVRFGLEHADIVRLKNKTSKN